MGNGEQSEMAAQSQDFTVRYPAGSYVFRQGDPGAAMFIIQSGEVAILRTMGGREQRLAVLEEGDFFGEMAVLEDLPRVASARAENDCTLLRIDATTFDQMARHNPEIPVRMLRKLSARLREVSAPADLERPSSTAAVQAARAATGPTAGSGPQRVFLVHPDSGAELPLVAGGESFIGRVDPSTGFTPTVELKPHDPQRSTSRRHARIIARDGRYFLREEIGVANGTFVNDERVATGVEVPLTNGDEVKFGLVRMRFRVA